MLQETKAKQGQAEIDLPQYQEFWGSAERPGYSGVAMFTKIKPLKVNEGLPDDIVKKYKVEGDIYGDPNKEGRVITAEFDAFFVVGVYTINVKDDLSRVPIRQAWDQAFLDLNVAHTEDDLARPKENVGKRGFTAEERAGFGELIKHGFVDTFRLFHKGNGHYTWWTHWANARARNVGWRIDYFLVSESLKSKVQAADIHAEQMGSDHCPISLTLKI